MSELVKVYSPDGEMFENSPANARDLVTHVGWTYEKPTGFVEAATVIVEQAVVQEKVSENILADQAEEETKEDEQEESEAEGEEVKASTRGRKKKV